MSICDVQINNTSVSRCHAILKLLDNSIYLNDNNSKFGTLIEIVELVPDKVLTVQVKDMVVTLLVRELKLIYEDILEEKVSKYKREITGEHKI